MEFDFCVAYHSIGDSSNNNRKKNILSYYYYYYYTHTLLSLALIPFLVFVFFGFRLRPFHGFPVLRVTNSANKYTHESVAVVVIL